MNWLWRHRTIIPKPLRGLINGCVYFVFRGITGACACASFLVFFPVAVVAYLGIGLLYAYFFATSFWLDVDKNWLYRLFKWQDERSDYFERSLLSKHD